MLRRSTSPIPLDHGASFICGVISGIGITLMALGFAVNIFGPCLGVING